MLCTYVVFMTLFCGGLRRKNALEIYIYVVFMTEFSRGIRRNNAHYICRFDDTNFWGNSAKKCFSCCLKIMLFFLYSFFAYFGKNFFFSTNIVRWCACSVCEQWRKWNGVLFKVVLPSHKDPCSCTCPFCDSDCCSIERISPRYMMEHLLCPPSRQFALSSVSLYSWDCIYNRFTISLFCCFGSANP